MPANVQYMASRRFRSTSLSRYNESWNEL